MERIQDFTSLYKLVRVAEVIRKQILKILKIFLQNEEIKQKVSEFFFFYSLYSAFILNKLVGDKYIKLIMLYFKCNCHFKI